jgi:hypothetical protein
MRGCFFNTLSIQILRFSISSRPNWVPPPPHPQKCVLLPSLGKGGEAHSLAGEGGGPNSDNGTDTIEL